MKFALTWLADVLKTAGLKVQEVDGWETRGRGDVGDIQGVLCHHTAGAKNGNMPTLDLLIKGRPDLPGPLSQLGLARDGTYFIIAAGKCNHAGPGYWKGIRAGNTHLIGIEAENTGLPNDPWPAVQVEAYQLGAAAMLKHVGRSYDFCVGHKEWAPKRKTDPSFDMGPFREAVKAIMTGEATAPGDNSGVAAQDGDNQPPARPTLKRGATGELVKELQAKIGAAVDGQFGPGTAEKVRAFQREHNLDDDGIVGPATWRALDQTLT